MLGFKNKKFLNYIKQSPCPNVIYLLTKSTVCYAFICIPSAHTPVV